MKEQPKIISNCQMEKNILALRGVCFFFMPPFFQRSFACVCFTRFPSERNVTMLACVFHFLDSSEMWICTKSSKAQLNSAAKWNPAYTWRSLWVKSGCTFPSPQNLIFPLGRKCHTYIEDTSQIWNESVCKFQSFFSFSHSFLVLPLIFDWNPCSGLRSQSLIV